MRGYAEEKELCFLLGLLGLIVRDHSNEPVQDYWCTIRTVLFVAVGPFFFFTFSSFRFGFVSIFARFGGSGCGEKTESHVDARPTYVCQ